MHSTFIGISIGTSILHFSGTKNSFSFYFATTDGRNPLKDMNEHVSRVDEWKIFKEKNLTIDDFLLIQTIQECVFSFSFVYLPPFFVPKNRCVPR